MQSQTRRTRPICSRWRAKAQRCLLVLACVSGCTDCKAHSPSPLRAFLIKGLGIFYYFFGPLMSQWQQFLQLYEMENSEPPITALAIEASCAELGNWGNWAVSEGHYEDQVAVSCISRLLSQPEVIPLIPVLQYFPGWLSEYVQWCPSTLKQLPSEFWGRTTPVGEQTRTFPSPSPSPPSVLHPQHHHSRPKGRILWSFSFKPW